MAEDALWTVLRDQRHKLKSEWQERAVGEESVRVEYWQELKESIAREEHVVKQQNTRLADQKLLDALRTWQEWLDDDGGSWSQGWAAIVFVMFKSNYSCCTCLLVCLLSFSFVFFF